MATKIVNEDVGGSKTFYSYNIHGWLVDIHHPYMRLEMSYNNDSIGFNGNITKLSCSLPYGLSQNYSFTYDGLNRMLNADYSEGYSMNQNLDRYTEKVTGYDKNGNILGLQRYGQTGASSYGLVDDLTYTYNGNKLTKVEDATTATSYTGGTNFINGASTNNEYTYDANGNLTKDLNKNISNIQYNSLNLPSVVTFSDGSTIRYMYSADGTKLRTTHVINGTTTTTDYCGNVIYENGTAQRLLTDEGYVDLTTATPTYYYYLKDHQGNNRVVINGSGTVQETNHYYPFGGLFSTSTNVQPYKYNGKRLDSYLGLDWYDYGARHYDAALGRWHVVDPMAEKYYSSTSYGYCLNNPIRAIDKEGKLVIFINGMHNGFQGGKSSYWNTEYGQFDAAVMKYLNDNSTMYIDGSLGGIKGLPVNLDPDIRHYKGWITGLENVTNIINSITNDKGEIIDNIKVITHSMGSAFAKGFLEALVHGLSNHNIPLSVIAFEADFAPFQPSAQEAICGIKTIQFSNTNDWVANNKWLMSPFSLIDGVDQYFIVDDKDKEHPIADFYDMIKNLPAGNYKVENGEIILK